LALLPTDPKSPNQREAAQQDGFLREVDEALREQQFVDSLRRYGKPLGAAIVIGLLSLAGYLWWDNNNKGAAAERSEQTIIALDRLSGDGSASAKLLEPLAAEGSPGSKANAAMLSAAIAQQQGKSDEAVKGFAAIAADLKAPQPLRDLATIREIAIGFDKLPPQQVVDRLKPLAVPGNPWFGSAGELVALAYLKQGKPELAGPLFAAIAKDKDAPQSLRDRMRQMAAQLGVGTGDFDQPSAALAPTGQ
jgi:hypothetical protein